MRYLILLVFLFSYSCSDSNRGCTDIYAYNYDEYANYDDGSCFYKADVTFYLDVSGAYYFDNLGVQELHIFIDGVYRGKLLGNLGFAFIPPCDPPDPDAFNFSIEWQNNINPNIEFTYSVRDGDDGFEYFDGTETVSANDCLTLGFSDKKIKEYLDSK